MMGRRGKNGDDGDGIGSVGLLEVGIYLCYFGVGEYWVVWNM